MNRRDFLRLASKATLVAGVTVLTGNNSLAANAENDAETMLGETSVVYDWMYKVLNVDNDNLEVITLGEWINVATIEKLSPNQIAAGAIVVSHWLNGTVPTETDVIFTGPNQEGKWAPLAINALREGDEIITPYGLAIRAGVDPTLFLAKNNIPVRQAFNNMTDDQAVEFRFLLPPDFK